MSEVNRAIIARLFEDGLNQQKLETFGEIIDGGFVEHDPASSELVCGPEGVRQSMASYWAAFPDLHFTVNDLLAEADRVAIRWTAHGTHQGELMGLPATGRHVTAAGISIYRLAHGKIVEGWSNWDMLGMLRQLEEAS